MELAVVVALRLVLHHHGKDNIPNYPTGPKGPALPYRLSRDETSGAYARNRVQGSRAILRHGETYG